MAFETFSANLIEGPSSRHAFEWPEWLEKKAWDIEHLLLQHKADLISLMSTPERFYSGWPE